MPIVDGSHPFADGDLDYVQNLNDMRESVLDIIDFANAYDPSDVEITGGDISTTNVTNCTVTGGTVSGLATDLAIADGGTGASNAADARTNLGLGSMAVQNAGTVAITGGTMAGVAVSGGSITGTTIDATTTGVTRPLGTNDTTLATTEFVVDKVSNDFVIESFMGGVTGYNTPAPKFLMGKVTISANSTETITFPTFFSSVKTVQLTPIMTGGSIYTGEGALGLDADPTTSGFTIINGQDWSGSVMWLAIGE